MKPSVQRHLDRRTFLQVAPAPPPLASAPQGLVTNDDLEAIRQNVKTASQPSKLQITDLRFATHRRRADDLSDHPHRHQSGHLGLR